MTNTTTTTTTTTNDIEQLTYDIRISTGVGFTTHIVEGESILDAVETLAEVMGYDDPKRLPIMVVYCKEIYQDLYGKVNHNAFVTPGNLNPVRGRRRIQKRVA
jgi:hypothetical protein